ncbi:hypothetical protein FSP39_000864 [Pinctada imbricata]|uniref:Alpha-type protein kinase domain-containing protein n=1 Tax=Pinctada imbricata TaxID=66713 RepID=A0AA88XHH6_PINIB|nr:hypothetical protein FSP39_000864 [Pinctada imbricata]
MGQQISVETLVGYDENSSGKYWSSFEPYPHKCGQRKLAYLGILNGNGPRKGDKCIVKALRNQCATYNDWNSDITVARHAKQLSSVFSKELEVRDIRAKIIFNIPILVEIDEVSSYMCLSLFLGKPRKSMKEFEIVALEPFIEGKFTNFESVKIDFSDSVIVSAFSHFSWYHSNGLMLLYGFKGVTNLNVFRLTIPKIHSRDRKFGSHDLGQMGIDSFFANHQCSEICRYWPRPDDHFYKTRMSKKQMELLTFEPERFLLTGQSERCPLESDRLIDGSWGRNPVKATVHCDQHSGCVCRYFRLPCHHRVEPVSSVLCLMNHRLPDERNV